MSYKGKNTEFLPQIRKSNIRNKQQKQISPIGSPTLSLVAKPMQLKIPPFLSPITLSLSVPFQAFRREMRTPWIEVQR